MKNWLATSYSLNRKPMINLFLQIRRNLGCRARAAEKIICKFLRNSFSGSLIELISMPKQHELITSKV